MHDTAAHILENAPLRYRISRKLNLFLAKKLKVPRVQAIRIARTVNILAKPFTQIQRRRAADEIIRRRAGSKPAVAIDKQEGYAFTSPKEVPEISGAIAQASEIYRAAAEKQALERVEGGTSRKAFMMQAAEGAAMNRYTDIMRAAVARPVLDAVAEYLGEVPILGNVTIMVSVPNNTQVGSQLYHLDFADEKQIKLFIYVDEVTQDNGPFTFTPISVTNELIKAYGYDRGRLTIDEVEKAVGTEKEIQVTGPAGTALLCDTSRCLHYGSNRNKTTRIVLLIQYVAHAVPEQPPAVWPVEDIAKRIPLDDIQRMSLTV
ncbi:MAG: phytanoyl-CoA dioxygenase family protein [Hyphomicrobiales bacterium]